MDFHGKVVLITGSSSGIGAATAEEFAKLGACLALTGRNLTNLGKVAAKCKTFSGKDPFLFTGDLTNETDVTNLAKSVLGHFKRLDVLVNNAGTGIQTAISLPEKNSMDRYDKIMNTNMRSIYQLTALLVPHLIATKGSIVNVSSYVSSQALLQCLAYCMSKSALDSFTRNIALELAPRGVRVNGVSPGLIPTNILRGACDNETYMKWVENWTLSIPIGRVGLAEEVAKSIAFLASDHSGYTTGSNLVMDGGKQWAYAAWMEENQRFIKKILESSNSEPKNGAALG